MIPGSFTYQRPSTEEEAVKLLGDLGDEARPLAGGHSLIPMMKLRLAVPEHLVDLQDIDGLSGIRDDGVTISIGAMTTQEEVLGSALLRDKCPILPETSWLIADPQVRACGTIGGNVANGDPGNDMPALMQCLGATYVLHGTGGQRTVAARDYYEAAYYTAIEEGEILTEVRIPAPPAGHGWAYEKMKRKVGDYATAAAAVILTLSGGSCTSASVALTNVGQTPIFVAAAGEALVGTSVDDGAINEAARQAREAAEPVADMRGPEDFRAHVAGVMVRRAVARARGRAQ